MTPGNTNIQNAQELRNICGEEEPLHVENNKTTCCGSVDVLATSLLEIGPQHIDLTDPFLSMLHGGIFTS